VPVRAVESPAADRLPGTAGLGGAMVVPIGFTLVAQRAGPQQSAGRSPSSGCRCSWRRSSGPSSAA
jgi:hypothetical protein